MATKPVMLVASWLPKAKLQGAGRRRLSHRSFRVSSHVRRLLSEADGATRLAFAGLLL
ncbi:MAG: hypothetical protein KDA05_01980 [Phycisphaerales bacterium]|nr:hypothetical protein [Phycisphaerales bacterium]MCB9840661.1 hypothetical protein [Phycisphaeraceae bacterium]